MRLSSLRNLSTKDLSKLVRAKALEKKLPKIQTEIRELEIRAASKRREHERLEIQIAKLLGSRARLRRAQGGPVKKRARNPRSLRQVMAEILKKEKKPLAAAEVARIALKKGFKTTSKNEQVFKANAANVLRLSPEFVKREGKYSLKS